MAKTYLKLQQSEGYIIQAAAQIYAASLMAIDVDTDVEKRYMQEFASKLGLSQPVLAYMHQAVGLA